MADKAKEDAVKPTGVQKTSDNAPSKPVPPQTTPPAVDHLKKDDKETAGPASAKNPAEPVKSSDTPETDVGKGGTVATTGNESPNRVAEPGTPNTPNPPPKAAGVTDTPPATGLETPSGGVRTSTGEHASMKSETPEPDDGLPVPDDDTLDALDDKHGFTRAVRGGVDSANYEDEKASARKFKTLAERLPDTTPNGGIFGGFGGVTITYGDIRNVAKAASRGLDD